MKKNWRFLGISALICIACSSLADDVRGIDIDFVPVGSPGFAADTTGYGYVDYNYSIGSTEVTIAQFEAYRSLTGGGSGNEDHWIALGSNAPASEISWHEAARFCNYLTSGDVDLGVYSFSAGVVTGGDRATALSTYGTIYVLPTEDEWYKAAYFTGSGYSLYANGTGTEPLNGDDAVFGGASDAWVTGQGSPEQNGTYDLMGNVWEWTENAADGNLDTLGEDIAFRGGAYNASANFLRSDFRSSDDPNLQHQAVGMRVVMIPEPGTISLMSLSTLGLFFTRSLRRRRLAGRSLLPVTKEHFCDSYMTFEQWAASCDSSTAEQDVLSVSGDLVKVKVADLAARLQTSYTSANIRFWNYMVNVHERKVLRRNAFRKNIKRNALETLDAFLALILK